MEQTANSSSVSAIRGLGRVCLMLCLFCATQAFAQKDTGNIVGKVTDQSGAAVADAKVNVTDADRGTTFLSKTNSDGDYVAGPLKPGRYNVSVEKTGFKRSVIGPVELNIQERPAVDVTLQVGAVTETLTVTSEGPQLETETSDLGQASGSQPFRLTEGTMRSWRSWGQV